MIMKMGTKILLYCGSENSITQLIVCINSLHFFPTSSRKAKVEVDKRTRPIHALVPNRYKHQIALMIMSMRDTILISCRRENSINQVIIEIFSISLVVSHVDTHR